jgi:lysophospholipase L1-like esterase
MGILDAPGFSRSALSRALTRQRSSILDKGTYGAANQGNVSDGTNICMNTRYQHTAPISGYSLVYVFGNFYNQFGGEVDGFNDLTVRAAHETSAGLIIPVRFGGKRVGTVEPGGLLYSDPIGVSLAVGNSFWSRTNVSVTAGQKWPLMVSRAGVAGVSQSTTFTDLTLGGSISDASLFRGYGPIAILAFPNTPDQPVIGINGDSISAGSSDSDIGWPTRWLNYKYSVINTSYSNGRWNHWGDTNTSNWRRAPLLDPCTDIVMALGINDLIAATSTTLAQAQAAAIAAWDRHRKQGKRVHAATILPSTTSTDGWTTTANQTVTSYEALRVQINDWLRTHPSQVTTVIEAADAAETARNSGKWKSTGGSWVADGIHPNALGAAGISAALPAAPGFLGLPVGV